MINDAWNSSQFLIIWIGFLGLMIGCIGAIFLWAIRSRQFTGQDRARYLALECGRDKGSQASHGGS